MVTTMSDEKTSVGMKVPPKLKDRIDEYKEAEGFTNRSDALRTLIEDGLDRYENPDPAIPIPVAVTWFGSLLVAVALTPAPGTTPELLVGAGLVVMLVGGYLARDNRTPDTTE